MVGILVDLFSIYKWPTTNIAAANTTVVGQLVDRSFRLDDQWPKNSHNRMITGMGTPISQSKSPRPIAASLKPYGFKTQKGRFGFRRK
jgi:hypothetical protein